MKPLSSQEIRGTWATVLLPIDSFDRIDFVRLEDELDYLLASGVDGLYTNGTSSEFYAQSETEFDRIQEAVSAKCEKLGMPYQIGVSHMSPQVSLGRLTRVRGLRPGAVQVILPDWWPPTDQESIDFLQRIAETADPIPLVLYNPPHAKRLLSPQQIGDLADAVPALVGIKVASRDENWWVALSAHAARLSIFIEGHRLASSISKGAAGSYSNVACLHPRGAKRWNDLMSLDLSAALAIEGRLNRFLGEYILPLRDACGYSNQCLDKLLAAIGNWSNVGTRLRWPYRGVADTEPDRLRPIARRLLPEILVS